MKLDSEEQRKDLIELLGSVRMQTTIGTIDETVAEVRRIMTPIYEAELEPVDHEAMRRADASYRPVVPIESLAPDPLPRLEAVS